MAAEGRLQEKTVHTIDLNFLGYPQAIAVYLIPHAQGAALIESGPGSTQEALTRGLGEFGLVPGDITDVFLTHIHLDHGGAAGWLARQGARIHVHPNGAPHLLDPEKLLASATRIYGDMMDTLWGQFLPVPQDRLSILEDGQVVEIGNVRVRALDTPGHANHHYAYIYEETCFSGDIGGVRLPGPAHLRLPMPPPEFHLEKWRESLQRLRQAYKDGAFRNIAPTHFGVFEDAGWHLAAIDRALNEVEQWIEATMASEPSFDTLNESFLEWTRQRSLNEGIPPALLDAYEAANPSWMSSHGIQRYWKKYRGGAN